MARIKEREFRVYPRRIGEKTVWYFYSYSPNGRRLAGKSTGVFFTAEKDRARTRREAEAYCQTLLDRGELGKQEGITLRAWVEARHFWDWRKSTYVRRILSESPRDKPGITEGYCLLCQGRTVNHILPAHGDKPIEKITPYDCEQLRTAWMGQMSNGTVNGARATYSTILGEYERELKMRDPRSTYFNPWRIVKSLPTSSVHHGALTVSEAKRILSPDGVDGRELVYLMATRLAFAAGLRIAEICGLFVDDVIDFRTQRNGEDIVLSYLEISAQWNEVTKKRTATKDKETRRVPITAALRKELDPFLTGSGKYIFSFSPAKNVPMNSKTLRGWLYRRMEEVGINDREKRGITFHSSRRFFNTLLSRENVDGATIRKFTGHDSEEMTKAYTDYLPEDMQEISRAQERFLLEE